MTGPFPGMDPYLEHPVLWEGVHARLIVAIANQLQPMLDPRYVTSVEERVFIEGPQRRIPDVWIQRDPAAPESHSAAVAGSSGSTAVILEVEDLEVRQSRLEILDAYNNMKLVTVVELISPTNKHAGPGRESYEQKQSEILSRDCHLVEIDLLRTGQHVASVPNWRVDSLRPFDYLACVNRWPKRSRYEVHPIKIESRLPIIQVPLADPDPDVRLDLQAALEQVYADGRYARRLRYGEPPDPPLGEAQQQWATERVRAWSERAQSA